MINVLFDNVNFKSNSGPNGFAKKLIKALEKDCNIQTEISKNFIPDIQLSFITSHYQYAPIVQRLDGIYFNIEQDFKSLNNSIRETYNSAAAAIFQSDFNKTLVENWFGKKEFTYVIRNGTDLDKISSIKELSHPEINKFENVWSTASSWRPHKRLGENIKYFMENASKNDCLIIAGENPDVIISDPRIFYAGNLSWPDLISLFKKSKYFIHLAWLDHCPNVVIDARASGCHIICSSSGGTKEIAGRNSTIIVEEEWDYSPIRLYNPLKMDFSKKEKCDINSVIDIRKVAKEYYDIFKIVEI
jgi:glycosyltransferase involved in cell wall biosynthesis